MNLLRLQKFLTVPLIITKMVIDSINICFKMRSWSVSNALIPIIRSKRMSGSNGTSFNDTSMNRWNNKLRNPTFHTNQNWFHGTNYTLTSIEPNLVIIHFYSFKIILGWLFCQRKKWNRFFYLFYPYLDF